MPDPLLSICQHSITQHGPVLATLLLAGLVGSFTHCAGMCGPFVMTQTAARLHDTPAAGMSEWQRLKGAALLPYQLGRITTYIMLGVMASLLTQGIIQVSGFRLLASLLLMAAGVLFLVTALGGILPSFRLPKMPLVVQIQSGFSALIRSFFLHPTGLSGYILGLLLGFLPCSLLYSALLIAGASDPVTAVLGMLLFGLGTVPALFMVSYGTLRVRQKFRPAMEKLGRALLLVNGVVLIALAGQKLM